jgi:hypothetical protein
MVKYGGLRRKSVRAGFSYAARSASMGFPSAAREFGTTEAAKINSSIRAY